MSDYGFPESEIEFSDIILEPLLYEVHLPEVAVQISQLFEQDKSEQRLIFMI
jgi:hypothetical protein